MTVNLSQRGQEMLETALARGLGRTPEEIVERALETVTEQEVALSDQLSADDAAYLELAIRDSLPLATLDGDLRTAALAAGVPLVTEEV